MTRDNAFQQVLGDFLDDGPEVAPRELLGSVLTTVATRHVPQRRFGAWRRSNVLSIPVRAAAAVAAVVIVAAAGLTLAGVLKTSQVGPAGPTGSIPSPSPSPSPVTATAAPQPTTLVTGAVEITSSTKLSLGTTYTMARFRPTLTFTGQAGWWVLGDDPSQLVIWRSQGNIGQGLFVVMRPGQVLDVGGAAAPVPADLAAWLKARSDLALGKPETVTVGGIKGTRFEGTVRADAPLNGGGAINIACAAGNVSCTSEDGGDLGVAGGDHFYLVVLKVRGEDVLIDMTAHAAVWSTVQPQFQAVLSSLAFPAVGG